MSWFAVGGAVIGAAGAYFGAKEQNKGSSGRGHVDITHQTSPYAGSMEYRNAGSALAYQLLTGMTPPPGAAGFGDDFEYTPTAANFPTTYHPPLFPSPNANNGGLDPNAGLDKSAAAGPVRINKKGKPVPAKGGGGGATAAKAPGFQGQSQETASAVANASRVASGMENSAVTKGAQDYTAGTLAGEDRNPYRTEAAGMVRDLKTSNSDRLIDMLFNSDTGLDNGSSGSSSSGRSSLGGAGVSYGYAAGTGGAPGTQSAEGSGPVGASKYLKDILEGGDTPYAPAMRERIKRQADDAYNEAIRQRRLEASGSNMYGGSGQMADEAFATGRYGAGLADAYAAQDYDTYRQALGLASQYDTSSLDRQANERMAGASLGAGASAQAAALASQERMGRLDALSRAVEYGGNYGLARAGAMGDIGSDFSNDQRFALGSAGDVNGMGQTGYLNAGGLSLGSDQARNAWQSSQNQLAASRMQAGAARAGLNLQRDQFNFDVSRYQHDQPWTDVSRFMGIISGAYDPFSETREIGYDSRSGAPPVASPWGSAIAGAGAGAALGQQFQNSYNQNRGSTFTGGGWGIGV